MILSHHLEELFESRHPVPPVREKAGREGHGSGLQESPFEQPDLAFGKPVECLQLVAGRGKARRPVA